MNSGKINPKKDKQRRNLSEMHRAGRPEVLRMKFANDGGRVSFKSRRKESDGRGLRRFRIPSEQDGREEGKQQTKHSHRANIDQHD